MAAKIETAWAWLATADPYPDVNGDHFADLRRVLMRDNSPPHEVKGHLCMEQP